MLPVATIARCTVWQTSSLSREVLVTLCDEREGEEKEPGDICSCKTLYEVLEPKSDVWHHINSGRSSNNPARIRPTVEIRLSTFGHDAKIFSLSFLGGIVSQTQSCPHAPPRSSDFRAPRTCARLANALWPSLALHYNFWQRSTELYTYPATLEIGGIYETVIMNHPVTALAQNIVLQWAT